MEKVIHPHEWEYMQENSNCPYWIGRWRFANRIFDYQRNIPVGSPPEEKSFSLISPDTEKRTEYKWIQK
jgi:hypothetical protein